MSTAFIDNIAGSAGGTTRNAPRGIADLFLDNKYTKWYFNIIESKFISLKKKNGQYFMNIPYTWPMNFSGNSTFEFPKVINKSVGTITKFLHFYLNYRCNSGMLSLWRGCKTRCWKIQQTAIFIEAGIFGPLGPNGQWFLSRSLLTNTDTIPDGYIRGRIMV